MKSHPMIFSTEMVRAIRDSRKSMTRRIVKERDFIPSRGASFKKDISSVGTIRRSVKTGEITAFLEQFPGVAAGTFRERIRVGDEIWVREAFQFVPCSAGCEKYPEGFDPTRSSASQPNAPDKGVRFKATWKKSHGCGWKPSIHMPRWASRITLRVTSVRIERLWDITDEDAIAEGCKKCGESGWVYEGSGYDKARLCHSAPSTAFACRWDELHKPGHRWEDNPTVMVIGFERQETGKV